MSKCGAAEEFSHNTSKENVKVTEIRKRIEYLEVLHMDLSTIFGLVIGFIALFLGMAMKGVALSSLFNVAAILYYHWRDGCSSDYCVSDE